MGHKNHLEIAAQKLEDILAAAPDFILSYRSNALAPLQRHLGMSLTGLGYYIPNEIELIRLLCMAHLNAAFEAVYSPVDWCGTPIEVLRAMSLALLRHAEEKPSRHLVFLLHRQNLHAPARNALDTLLTYLTNNFQLAFQGVRPEKPFDSLHSIARMLLGEILHLPLWWPETPHICKDEWLCHRIGQLAETGPPDWRVPAATRVNDQIAAHDDWGGGYLPNRFMV